MPSLNPGPPIVEPGLPKALPSLQPLLIQINFPSLVIISNQRATSSTVLPPGKEGARPPVSEDSRPVAGKQVTHGRAAHDRATVLPLASVLWPAT